MPEFINSKRGYKVANCWLAGEMQRERERERERERGRLSETRVEFYWTLSGGDTARDIPEVSLRAQLRTSNRL